MIVGMMTVGNNLISNFVNNIEERYNKIDEMMLESNKKIDECQKFL
jgi:hypothetical protein